MGRRGAGRPGPSDRRRPRRRRWYRRIVGHFWNNIPKDKVREAADLLESGQSGLVIVAVNKHDTAITPLLSNAEKFTVIETTAGNLQADLDKELSDAKVAPATG